MRAHFLFLDRNEKNGFEKMVGQRCQFCFVRPKDAVSLTFPIISQFLFREESHDN